MTMAHSLEARSPFLDHEVLELAARLPESWKVRGTTTKRILRELFAELLPASITRRGKMGFSVPLGLWFRGPLAAPMRDILLAPATPAFSNTSAATASRRSSTKMPPAAPTTANASGRCSTSKSGCKNMALIAFAFSGRLLCGLLVRGACRQHRSTGASSCAPRRRSRKKKPAPKPSFDKRDTAYFRALATMLGYRGQRAVEPADAARLAAYDRIELNKLPGAPRRGASPPPLRRAISPSRSAPRSRSRRRCNSPLGGSVHALSLRADQQERPRPACADSFPERSLGFRGGAGRRRPAFKYIADEIERAVAIWRFVCRAARLWRSADGRRGRARRAQIPRASTATDFAMTARAAVATLAELSGLRSRSGSLMGMSLRRSWPTGTGGCSMPISRLISTGPARRRTSSASRNSRPIAQAFDQHRVVSRRDRISAANTWTASSAARTTRSITRRHRGAPHPAGAARGRADGVYELQLGPLLPRQISHASAALLQRLLHLLFPSRRPRRRNRQESRRSPSRADIV